MNGGVPKIPYPWLVFNEKVKVNSVFIRDSTAVSDSVLLLFGGSVSRGGLVCFFNFLCAYSSMYLMFLVEDTGTDSVLAFIGWALENVRRVLGILHET